MALVFSTAVRNFVADYGSWTHAFNNGRIELYSGTQPSTTTADLAPTGNLLCTLTLASGAKTDEVLASGTVTLNTGAAGSVDTLTVNGLEIMGSSTPFNTSLTQTAADVTTKCQRNPKNLLYKVTSAGAVITITVLPGMGTLPNGWVVASTATTITQTSVNMASGVLSVNGLSMDVAVAGVIQKSPLEVWSGTVTGAGTQTAGWFRFKGSIADDNTLDSTNVKFIRMDGTISTTGANMNMSNTSLVNGVTQTLNTFAFTVPPF
jgi:hypothetical protein